MSYTPAGYADYGVNLAIGKLQGLEHGIKFGRNPDVDTAAAEDVWEGGGDYTGQPDSYTPETVEIDSTDGNDTAAGTGAQEIRIIGLKTPTSPDYESEDIVLNGTTNVTSVNAWWRINRCYVLSAGTGATNAGTIQVASTNSGHVFASMLPGYAQTQVGAFTVPYGKLLIIKRIRLSITRASGAAGSATVTVRSRQFGGVYRAIRVFELQTGAIAQELEFAGTVFPAQTDIKLRVDSVSDNNTIVDGSFEWLMLDS